jgi:hypothetical protein
VSAILPAKIEIITSVLFSEILYISFTCSNVKIAVTLHFILLSKSFFTNPDVFSPLELVIGILT